MRFPSWVVVVVVVNGISWSFVVAGSNHGNTWESIENDKFTVVGFFSTSKSFAHFFFCMALLVAE